MKNYIEYLLSRIEDKNPGHFVKLKENLKDLGDDYFNLANPFYEKYEKYLKANQLTLDYGIRFLSENDRGDARRTLGFYPEWNLF